MTIRKRLFAVIHVESQAQAVRNAKVAEAAGCDGVFLISHGKLDWCELLWCVKPCLLETPYIGLNFLDLSWTGAKAAIKDELVMGLWLDETHYGPKPETVELFSGYAFKYKPQPRNLEAGAQIARHSCHVLTTSGPGTGKPADLDKIRRLKGAIGPEHRLGIASGVTIDNVEDFLPYADDFLVATGISRSRSELDLGKARELAALVHR